MPENRIGARSLVAVLRRQLVTRGMGHALERPQNENACNQGCRRKRNSFVGAGAWYSHGLLHHDSAVGMQDRPGVVPALLAGEEERRIRDVDRLNHLAHRHPIHERRRHPELIDIRGHRRLDESGAYCVGRDAVLGQAVASAFVSIHTPALLTEYSPTPGVGMRAAPEAILMMRPPLPDLSISPAQARSVRNTPSRLTLITLRQLARLLSVSGTAHTRRPDFTVDLVQITPIRRPSTGPRTRT